MKPKYLVSLVALLLVGACDQTTQTQPTATSQVQATTEAAVDLAGVKTYLLDKAGDLKQASEALKGAADRYYDLASGAGFDYAKMWAEKSAEVTAAIEEGRNRWKEASPLYEQIEGIVAGVPTLAEYDVILDAGASGAEGGDSVVPFDLTRPDGKVLPKPGNLFGVTESTLWGTFPDYTVAGVAADYNGDSKPDFAESLPEANTLKASAEALDRYVSDLQGAAQAWQPTPSDAFTALVVMVPTMSEYFESWKNSRFVAGEGSTQRDFVAISRLSDIVGILSGLQVVYGELKPMATKADPAQASQIESGLADLKTFVADVLAQEQGGKRFTPEEADSLGAEAQNRATALAGQVSQVAALLNISVQE